VLLGYARVSKGGGQNDLQTNVLMAADCKRVFEEATARAEGRIRGRRKKHDAAKRREIAGSVVSGRKPGAEMTRLCNVSQLTVSRIVAEPPDVIPLPATPGSDPME
jgi:hypothetical protein